MLKPKFEIGDTVRFKHQMQVQKGIIQLVWMAAEEKDWCYFIAVNGGASVYGRLEKDIWR